MPLSAHTTRKPREVEAWPIDGDFELIQTVMPKPNANRSVEEKAEENQHDDLSAEIDLVGGPMEEFIQVRV